MKTYSILAINKNAEDIVAYYEADNVLHAVEQFFNDAAPFTLAEITKLEVRISSRLVI